VRSKLWTAVTILMILSLVIGACAPAATPTPTPRPTSAPTAVPTATQVPTLKITVATDATWPPFEFVDETTKEFVGFDIDLMKAIAEAAGFEYEFVNVSWDPLLAGMASGEYDAAISAMTITEERAKQFDFSDPYFTAGQLIAVRMDNTSITGPADLAGKVVGAQLGTTGAIEIEENHPEATLKTYDDISQAFLDLINGQTDAVVADDPLVDAFVDKYAGEIKVVGEPLTAEEYGIAVKQGAPEILEAINSGLSSVKAQGVLEQLKAKWIEAPVPEVSLTIGQVTDMGGIDDKSFNQTAWKGAEMAVEQLGAEAKFLESQQQADYAKNIQQFVDEKLDLIVTIGYLLGVDTATAAIANPEQKFAIVDYFYPDCWPGAEVGKDCGSDVELPNVLGLSFATDEAAFLAGYLAAGMTKTGKVGTFGGIKIPTVTIFMKGLEAGVKYYNMVKGTSVEVLGWDNAADEGLFTGNFESTDDGRRFAESLMDEGADIIMPVAGPVGLGSAAACLERGTMLLGVDSDWYISAPEFQPTYLTSVLKNMDVAVFDAAKAVANGTFSGGTYVGTLKNDGVGIADFHEYDSEVSAEMRAELEMIKADLISGTLTVDGALGM
jgi:basic membrane protein A